MLRHAPFWCHDADATPAVTLSITSAGFCHRAARHCHVARLLLACHDDISPADEEPPSSFGAIFCLPLTLFVIYFRQLRHDIDYESSPHSCIDAAAICCCSFSADIAEQTCHCRHFIAPLFTPLPRLLFAMAMPLRHTSFTPPLLLTPLLNLSVTPTTPNTRHRQITV